MARKIVSRYSVSQNIDGTRDIRLYYLVSGTDLLSGIGAAEADYIIDLLRNERPVAYDPVLRKLSTWSPELVGEAEVDPDLNTWLGTHPSIAASVIWQDSKGAHPWPAWSAAWKAELRQAFNLARVRGSIAVAEVPPNLVTLADDETMVTVISQADAWAYFKASVAQSLAVEIDRQLPWSIQDYPQDQLAQLFDGRQMFSWNGQPEGYRLDPFRGVVPAPPVLVYKFLGTGGLIGSTRLNTIVCAIGWCHENLIHFTGGYETANMEDQWQYRGLPPMTRVLAGTVRTSDPQSGIMHRTLGCCGTTGFLTALLRVINIPVKLDSKGGHAKPWFMADSRYLSHGDDPYDALTKAIPPIPPSELLINQEKYEAWFGSAVSETDKQKNVGRRTVELALIYLPNRLLRAYCDDIAYGRGHDNGHVFEIFASNYTLAELEAQNLWARMDKKIASFGGCAYIP